MKIWNLDQIFENGSKTAIIVLNQPLPSKLLQKLWRKCPIKICADGGANRLMDLKLVPQIIVGDLDSLSPDAKSFYSDVQLVYIDDQDTNDFEKCLLSLNLNEIDKILAIGALGGRLDHQMANISIIQKYSELNIYLISNESIAFLLNSGAHTIQSSPDRTFGSTCGLLPVGRPAVVKTTGLCWNLGK